MDALQRRRHVHLLHEAVAQDEAVEAVAHLLARGAVGFRPIGLLDDLHRQQDDPLVQHLVVLQIVEQRVRHAIGAGGHNTAVPDTRLAELIAEVMNTLVGIAASRSRSIISVRPFDQVVRKVKTIRPIISGNQPPSGTLVRFAAK